MDLHESGSVSGTEAGLTGSVGAGSGSGPTDEALLDRFRQDDDAGAFEALVRRYESELFSYLRRYLGNAEMAEDVFQATFLQIHLKKDQFEEGRRFRPWR